MQDKDEYGLDRITENKIDTINKIYDLVIGMDIVKLDSKSKYFLKNEIFYKNVKYYCTKNNILGLIEYEKIIYLDASCIINKNIDNIFEDYHKSTYNISNDYEWKCQKCGKEYEGRNTNIPISSDSDIYDKLKEKYLKNYVKKSNSID